MDSRALAIKNSGSRCRVLLVEDDDLDVIAFHRAVDARGLDLDLQRATNAKEAFELLRSHHDEGRDENMLIVLDLNMPAMNGFEFLAELRSDPVLSCSIVIAYTTSDSPRDRHAAYNHHVAAYVLKDVVEDSTANLVDLLSAYLKTVCFPPNVVPKTGVSL
jgi:CheY-like chemotaxis protein